MDGDGESLAAVVRIGRRQQAKNEKLARIIAAATELFNERGYEATTTSAITEAAGVGAGTLFLYVASKDDLLVRVFQHELSRLWNEAFAADDPRGPLLDRLLLLFGKVTAAHERDALLARAFVKEVMFVSEAERTQVNAFMAAFIDRLSDMLANAQAQGELVADVPTRALAGNLWALYFHQLQLRYGDYIRPDSLDRFVRDAFTLQLRGLLAH
jgi:AcrR family transcriptional regulator